MKVYLKATQEFTHGKDPRLIGDIFATNVQDAHALKERGFCIDAEEPAEEKPKSPPTKTAAKKTASPKK